MLQVTSVGGCYRLQVLVFVSGYALDPSVNNMAVEERLVGDTGTADELKGTVMMLD